MERFLGWEPTETHTTTHPDGSETVTVVTREPEWNDRNRSAALALYDDERDRCPECGQPFEVCRNRDKDWFPQLAVCWATAARRVALRKFEALHEKAKPDEAGYLPTDGATVWVSQQDLTPDDDFLNPRKPEPEGGD